MQPRNLSMIVGCGLGVLVLLAGAAAVIVLALSLARGAGDSAAIAARAQEFTEAVFVKKDAAAAGAMTCSSTRYPNYGPEWIAGEVRGGERFAYRGFAYRLADDRGALFSGPGLGGADGHNGQVFALVMFERALAEPSGGTQVWLPRDFQFVLLREEDGTWCAWPGVEVER